MMLEQLVNDAPTILGNLPPKLYGPQNVKWLIELDLDGNWLNTICTASGDKKDKGVSYVAPILSKKRAAAMVANLLCDTAEYALGTVNEKRQKNPKCDYVKYAEDCHKLFMERLKDCHDKTNTPAVGAVLRYLENLAQPDNAEVNHISAIEPEDHVTWRVDDMMVFDLPAVRRYWAEANTSNDDQGNQSRCQICGMAAEIPERLPVALKNVPNGQSSGVPLVGYNSEAFYSYGLKSAVNASICQDCAQAYGQALNHMIVAEKMHLRLGPVITLFWKDSGVCDEMLYLDAPDPDAITNLLTAYRSGKVEALNADTASLYVLTISGNAGRAAIRDWMSMTVGQAKVSLARWFNLISIVDSFGEMHKPIRVVQLACCPYLDNRAFDQMSPQTPRVLVNCALKRTPLPLWLLSITVNRCRAEKDVTPVRAALMKAVLNSQRDTEDIMPELNATDVRPSYVCGRLLSVLEQIQQSANPGINATIVDRYFGAASTSPATVFGNLLSDAQAHLGKLRKTNHGAYEACQRRLEDVLAMIESDFPKTLTLHEQALFSLGYYHQRAATRRERTERMKQKDASSEDNNE